jgi:hypothetical protein
MLAASTQFNAIDRDVISNVLSPKDLASEWPLKNQ